MNKDNISDRATVLFLGTAFLICVIALVTVLNSIWTSVQPILNNVLQEISKFTRIDTTDYNFFVPPRADTTNTKFKTEAVKPIETNTTNNIQQNNTTNINQIDYSMTDYNFPVPELTTKAEHSREYFPDAILDDAKLLAMQDPNVIINQSVISISIPKIKISSPVLQGLNANELLNQGFWVSPTSYKLGQGEVVLLCHRRHFGPNDPRSCWYLDNLQRGDDVIINVDGRSLLYKVVGINVFDGEDPLIYTLSPNEDLIKIVTCTPLYSNAQRLVVLAKRER